MLRSARGCVIDKGFLYWIDVPNTMFTRTVFRLVCTNLTLSGDLRTFEDFLVAVITFCMFGQYDLLRCKWFARHRTFAAFDFSCFARRPVSAESVLLFMMFMRLSPRMCWLCVDACRIFLNVFHPLALAARCACMAVVVCLSSRALLHHAFPRKRAR